MKSSRQPASVTKATTPVRALAFAVSLALLALVPLVFSTAVHRTFTLPKVVVLLVGSAALVGLMGWTEFAPGGARLRLLRSPHVLLILLYVATLATSTAFGVAPRLALFGSFENQMGLLTRVCFLICCLSLVIIIGESRARLQQTLWAVTITGLVVATYGFAQFFGRDPFMSANLYTFASAAGRVVRVISTLGHADYLGNFLLYTTPVSAALALARQGRARLLALVATLLSTLVIVFSGTRGAIVGLAVGALALALAAGRRREGPAIWRDRRAVRRATVAALIVIGALGLIAVNPASRQIIVRARAAIAEGASGAGRTLLWRDTLAMLPAYGLTGCGPEGFRLAFLPYKSLELAQLAPQTNNESPHDAYLDVAVSNGVAGAIFYVAVLISAFWRLAIAARRAADREMKITCAGLIAALAAVAAHNIFIFDQIPTGLYFFAFAGLAQAAFNVVMGVRRDDSRSADGGVRPATRLLHRGIAGAGVTIFVIVSWYALVLVRADVEMRRSFAAALGGDFDGALAAGRAAANSAEATGAYQFELARSLALFADVAQARLNVTNISQAEAARLTAAREAAIREATAAARASLSHTLTPDASHLLLAYLAWLSKDAAGLREEAGEAIRRDPYFANGHWLMGEALLMAGDAAQAMREAETALTINPYSGEARDLFKRARGDEQETIEGLLAQAQRFVNRGRLRKARRRLLHALRESAGNCADCHRALALVYEADQQPQQAIVEWQAVAAQTADAAVIRQAQSHIEALKQQAAAR